VLVHEVRANGNLYLPVADLNLGVGEEYVTPDPRVWMRVTGIDPATGTATTRIWDAPNGSLRKEDSKPKVYLIENGAKRWVTSPQVLFGIGKTWGDVIVVPDAGLAGIPDGRDLYLLTVERCPVSHTGQSSRQRDLHRHRLVRPCRGRQREGEPNAHRTDEHRDLAHVRATTRRIGDD
jgi:hypothetical protein